MSYYSIALFLHIVGALGLFVALGLEWTGLWQLRSPTTSEQVRAWMPISKNARRLGMVSMLTILIAGSSLSSFVIEHSFRHLSFVIRHFTWAFPGSPSSCSPCESG